MENDDKQNAMSTIKHMAQTTRHTDTESDITDYSVAHNSDVGRCLTSNCVSSELKKETDIKKEKTDTIGYADIKTEPSDVPIIKPEQDCLMFWSEKEMKTECTDMRMKQES